MLGCKEYRVKMEFIEEVLGSASPDPEIQRTYIASKAVDAAKIEDEVAAIGVDAVDETRTTVFPRTQEGWPAVWDYQIKGMFKDACKSCRQIKGSKSSKITAYKTKIDGLLFIKERMIPFVDEEGAPVADIGICQRPLRAETAQGPRVALASSETVPAGTLLEFTVVVMDNTIGLAEAIAEWLDYGFLRGFGQWRNSGKGRFVYEIEEVEEAA